MRAMPAAIGFILLVATAAGAPTAWAEEDEAARRVVIVLDRGSAAEATHRTDANNALRIWASLAARGVDCRLVAAGVDGDGSTLVDAVPPTEPGLRALARRPVFAFRGPTDPRAVLTHVLADESGGAVDVILLGSFKPSDAEGEEGLAEVVPRWNAKAAAGSRILSVRNHPEARALLEGARGLATTGRLVVGFGEPRVEAEPFAPLGPKLARIGATIQVLADIVTLAGGKVTDQDRRPLLAGQTDVAADQVAVTALEGRHEFTVQRRPRDGRIATLSFARDSSRDDVLWLVEPPRPVTFRWDELAKQAMLVDADGKPAPPFTAVDVTAAAPRRQTLRLLRTRTEPAPAWRIRAAEGALPDGLTVEIGDEVTTSAEIAEASIDIVFTAQAGTPLEARGTLVLDAPGHADAVRLPFEIRVGQGKVTLEAEVHPAALPASADEPRTTLRLVAGNDNAPAAVRLKAVCDGGQEAWLRGLLTAPGGSVTRWNLREPLILDVGAERTLAFELVDGAPPEILWPCTVSIVPDATPGVTFEGGAEITVRKRQPRIEVVGTPPTFRLADGTLHAAQPLALRLDPDGGDGDYLLALLETPPSVRSRSGSIGWQAVARGQGVWHVVPTGEWRGAKPGLFRDQEEQVDLEIAWDAGRTPEPIDLSVAVPARWGKRGFVLIALALMALLLALVVIGYMRTPPARGVLLYTVDGLTGTVGRLELAAAGRKSRTVLADENGKLFLGPKGDGIARVRPTRVGTMLEYLDVSGTKERRLLVDGVSLRLGRHLVRYVYGRPGADEATPTPPAGDDLLGPEYDIASGRIDSLDEEITDPA